MIRRYEHFILGPLALLFQAAPTAFIYLAPNLFYGVDASLPEHLLWMMSMTGLAILSLLGMTLCYFASYLLLTRSRRLVAFPMVALFCAPAFLIAAIYLTATLMFMTWI